MKARIIVAAFLFLGTSAGQALACSVCYGAKDGKTTEHMAVAIWVLMGVVMTVMGGVGAFSFISGGMRTRRSNRINSSPTRT